MQANLPSDPRLSRDYLALWTGRGGQVDWWEYVRKDAVKGHEAGLAKIRAGGCPDH